MKTTQRSRDALSRKLDKFLKEAVENCMVGSVLSRIASELELQNKFSSDYRAIYINGLKAIDEACEAYHKAH